MERNVLASKLHRRVCCFVLFFVAAAASFNGYYDKWHFREPGVSGGSSSSTVAYLGYGFADMVDETAARPFIYRQLMPAIANLVDRVTPQAVKDRIIASNREKSISDTLFFSQVATNPVYFYRYLIFYFTTFLFVLLGVYGMYLVCSALEFPIGARVFAPVILILLMPYFLSRGGYFYDYPELAFMALVFWMALKFDWWWMVPVVALAAWNKESFLLFPVTLYPILRRRSSRASAVIGSGMLTLVCVLIYAVLRARYQQNPGGTTISFWREHLEQIKHPMFYLTKREKTYGVVMLRVFTLLPLALIGWTVWRAWSRVPEAIRRHAQIALAINVPLYLLFCLPGEMRDFSLMYMTFLVVLAVHLAEAIKGKPVATVASGA